MYIQRVVRAGMLGLAAVLVSGLSVTAGAVPRHPRVAVETTAGRFTLELDPEHAPQTVENFLGYARAGFYDGLIFHRVVRQTLIQGGGYTPRMEPRPTRAPIPNEAVRALPNRRHTIAMVRGADPNSATSQFFINLRDNPDLDAREGEREGYCVFGWVLGGEAVVDSIGRARTVLRSGRWQQPALPVVIQSVRLLDESPAAVAPRRDPQ